MMNKETLQALVLTITIGLLCWASISSIIQAFSCPGMTQTELLMHIPRSFVGDWGCK